MISVILTELGISIYEDEKCTKTFPFSNPTENYILIRKGKSKLGELSKFLEKNQEPVLVSDESILHILKKTSIECQLMNEKQIEEIQFTKPKIIVDSGFAKNENDAMSKLRDFAIDLSSSKVTEISGSPDLHTIQAINTLDETDKIMNAISSRLREWYGLHFPELENIVDSINGYSQIVLAGRREDLIEEVFKNAGFPDSKIEMLVLATKKSRGGEITDENLEILKILANQVLQLHKIRKDLEDNIEKQMNTQLPNVSAILGTAVGARILARAGSLKKFASIAASTIQVLGAEKALFRSLKTGSQPPKHGILFQHALVHSAPRWQRGKIARAIAAKAAIAARVDQYGEGLNQTLLDKLNVRVDEIGKKYKEPTERVSKPDYSNKKKNFKKKSKKSKHRKRKKFDR